MHHVDKFKPRSFRRWRRCLLKGCERRFRPEQPQSRYCSSFCQQAARRWRMAKASQEYRASSKGRERRRQQNRHYRQRRRERPLEAWSSGSFASGSASASIVSGPPAGSSICSSMGVPSSMSCPTGSSAWSCMAVMAVKTQAAAREGQRPRSKCEDCAQRMCARPGCYVLFGIRSRHDAKRFCSELCRLELRRVLDREAKYRQRRRRWRRERLRSRVASPDTS